MSKSLGSPTKQSHLDVLLVEDNPTDVLVVKSHIEELPGFRLETVERLSQAIESLKAKEWDIILLDLNLPDATGLEGLIKLRAHVENAAVIVFTALNDEKLGIMALQRGAQDYLIKGIDSSRLGRSMQYAIERMKAHKLTNPTENFDDVPSDPLRDTKPYEILTERELQVLKLLGKGCTNREILQTLGISVTTVKTHLGNIFRKISVSDRTKAIVEARNRGLI
jgi:DNA-binding NarL/FixJ family response regulator